PRLRVVQERLESEGKAYQGRALEEGIIHVGKAFVEKIELVEKFKSENAILRNSLQYLPTGTENFKEIIRDQPLAHGSQSGQFDLLEIRMNDVLTGILKFNLLPDAAAAERVMSQIEALEGIRMSYPSTLAGPMAALLNHARVVLRQRTIEDALLKRMTSVATAERVEDLTNSFGLEFHSALNEKQRYRTYLVAYSMLLLLLLGYAGWRLMKSYRVIAEINKELQVSNQTLERRVEERTAELSKALENLKQSESQLIQSEKMASLGQMIAGVAHEINTPLAYVRSSLETVGGHLTSFVAEVITESGKMMRLLKLDEIADKRVKDQFVKARELSTQFSEQQILEELSGLVKDGVYGVDQISELVLNLKNFARLDRGKVAKFNL
ncbi:MAG: DAHL domain-containing protein, partial [Pyrinomonadaceae bacterium]